jgi:FAD/FMN-containing dehydrogenase
MERRNFIRTGLAAAVAPTIGGREAWEALYRVVGQSPGDLEAVRGDGQKVIIKGPAIRELSQRLRGKLLLAKSPGYDDARRILNPAIDKHPALIAQTAGVADVQAAVTFAREYGLLTAVKCGGHSFSGQSTCDGGIMIDLGGLRGVRVDAAAKRATVAGGTLLGQVDQATQPHDLVTSLGTVSHTGVGGLTTGGGFGRVARRFGLALDNVTGVEVVTADGKPVRANGSENPDLYWGVRGGGGNFGIVTSFEFQLHPMPRRVVGGNMIFPIAKAREVLAWYAEYSNAAPDELYLDVVLQLPPGGAPGMVVLHSCYSGPADRADQVYRAFKPLGDPIANEVKAIEYVDIQRSGDVSDPRANSLYLKSGFNSQVDGKLIDALVGGLEAHPARMTQFFVAQCGGAIGRVPTADTAFPHRYAKQDLIVLIAWKAGTDGAPHMAWARKFWTTLEPFMRGFYTNDAADHPAEAIDANYRENFPRLVAVKKKYDPTNLFRLNANVRPA